MSGEKAIKQFCGQQMHGGDTGQREKKRQYTANKKGDYRRYRIGDYQALAFKMHL